MANIPVKNLVYLLYYALRASQDVELEFPDLENVSPEEFHDIRDLFAKLLSDGINEQLKQGLYREYVERLEDIPVMRGKLNIAGTIRNKVSQRQLLTCEYDELSENTLSNRILKTTAKLLLRDNAVKESRKDALRRGLLFFSNVEEIDNLTSIPWSQVRYHRSNWNYRKLILICRLILKGLLLTTEDGEYELQSLDKRKYLAKIYEKFLLGYYQEVFPDINANAQQITWALTDRTKRENGNKNKIPLMLSDITLSLGNRVLIIDAKCYQSPLQKAKAVKKTHLDNNDTNEEEEEETNEENLEKIRPAHLYQIFAYVKNKDVKENVGKKLGEEKCKVSGMLLYALPKSASPLDETYELDDIENTDEEKNYIYVRTLNLDQKFSLISEQLNKIATDFFPGVSPTGEIPPD